MNNPTPSRNVEHLLRHPLARHPLAVTFLGALAFLYLRCFALPGTPLIANDDRVVFFARALRIVHGQMLYRDFFELVTPGTDLLYAATFRVLGVHAWILQVWSVAIGIAICLVVTRIACRMFEGWMVLLPALLFLVFGFDGAPEPTHHWFSTLAALCAVSVLLGGGGLVRLFAAGALCGVATLFTQTQGGLTFLAVVLYLVLQRREEKVGIAAQLGALVLPYVLVLFGVLGYYVHQAGWHTMLFDLVVFPVKYLRATDDDSWLRGYLQHFPIVYRVSDLARFVPSVLIYAAVPYAYCFGLYRAWRVRDRQVVLVCLVGLALFLAVVHEPRFHRLCTVSPPAMLVGVWLMSGPGMAARRARGVLWALGIVFFMVVPLGRQIKRLPTLSLPTGRVAFTDPLAYREMQWLAARTEPGDLFFNNDQLGLYLALANPTASEWISDVDFTRPEEVSAAVAALRVHRPRFIVMKPKRVLPAYEHSNDGPFREFVRENYRLASVFPLDHNQWQDEIWELVPSR